jgi:uncharacterized protein with HEPN domain
MKPHDSERLRHMLDAAIEARNLLSTRNTEELHADRIRSLALVKLLEMLGEAAANVSPERQRQIPAIPWQDVIAMRHATPALDVSQKD